jgi:hypothetical protein
MIARRPEGGSVTNTTCSWPFAAMSSVIAAASVPIDCDGTVPRDR